MNHKYYGYINSPIGIVQVICSEEAVLEVDFVEKEKPTNEKNVILEEVLRQLAEYFAGQRTEFSVKLSLEGTEFQKLVWKELRNIPFGETISYKELATRIGNEKAMRAVGNANRNNPVGIIVPCHRVIGKNGQLVGYAGGLDRKKWLLEHEKTKVG